MPYLYIAGAVVFAACVASYIGSMRWLKIKHEKFYTDKNLSLKILLISDFHSNSLKRTNERIWENIHALDFDLAAITGDLLQSRLGELEPIKQHLRRLSERVPVFYVEGNHEKFIYTEVYRELEKIGVKGLENRRVRLKVPGGELDVVGVADYNRLKRERFLPVRRAFSGRNGEIYTLLLSHQPSIINKIEKYRPDLMLCGHTHGGQVRFPFLPALYAPTQGLLPRYDHGRYRVGETDIFVSKGVGATFFHIRFFNRPEVAVIEVCKKMMSPGVPYGCILGENEWKAK